MHVTISICAYKDPLSKYASKDNHPSETINPLASIPRIKLPGIFNYLDSYPSLYHMSFVYFSHYPPGEFGT